jgi:hypothetical protein
MNCPFDQLRVGVAYKQVTTGPAIEIHYRIVDLPETAAIGKENGSTSQRGHQSLGHRHTIGSSPMNILSERRELR